MKINIQTIPHKDQRYETPGDWFFDGDTLAIRVSDMGNRDYEFLVSIHEAIEAWLCREKGITMESIDAFDIDYEEARKAGGVAKCGCKPTETSEPGHDSHSPYRKEHQFAEKIEKMVARKRGVDWEKYGEAVNVL